MAMGLQYYPPSLKDTPRTLTLPGPRYLLYSVVVLISLFAFLALYLGLIAGSAYLVYLAVVYPITGGGRGPLFLKLGLIGCSVMLFLFLVKGLFKRHQTDLSELTEITESEQPELYAFIRRLCREVNAPFPHRVFVSPEVGAAVFYDTSLLNLIVPVKKNLVIGLGLVNALPINEFKAVLAHEFGHFSQSAMALGTYVYVANRVIADLVFGRDQLDDLLEEWKEHESSFVLFAWLLACLLWILRIFLGMVFVLMNLVRFALMRQMEFHADRVAVSVCGSDAIINALARVRFGQETLAQAVADALRGTHHGLFTRDLFFHQTQAADYLRRQHKDPTLGVPPALPENPKEQVQVFPPVDGGGSLWSTHPSLYDREKNAKRCYLRGPEDDRSSWLLFRDPEALRSAITLEVLQEHTSVPSGTTLVDPEEVQRLVDQDRAESTYDPRYHGLFDNRLIQPGDVGTQAQSVLTAPWPPAQLRQAYDRLYNGGYREWANQRIERSKEMEFLSSLQSGELRLKEKQFEFRGHRRPASAVPALLRVVEKEAEEDQQRAAAIDREIFLSHYQMAERVQRGAGQELLQRYQFHLSLQEIIQETRAHGMRTMMVLRALSEAKNLSEADVRQAVQVFREARAALSRVLATADNLPVPPMASMVTGDPLGRFLRPHHLLSEHYNENQMPEPQWVEQLLRQLGEVSQRSQGVLFKSMGGILSLQERIAATWLKLPSHNGG